MPRTLTLLMALACRRRGDTLRCQRGRHKEPRSSAMRGSSQAERPCGSGVSQQGGTARHWKAETGECARLSGGCARPGCAQTPRLCCGRLMPGTSGNPRASARRGRVPKVEMVTPTALIDLGVPKHHDFAAVASCQEPRETQGFCKKGACSKSGNGDPYSFDRQDSLNL
jgi:hypothetical protein